MADQPATLPPSSALLRERDKLRDQVEHLTRDLERERDRHRNHIAIECDTCKLQLKLSTTYDHSDADQARGMIGAAVFMRWRIGERTAQRLKELLGEPLAVITGETDACPTHNTTVRP